MTAKPLLSICILTYNRAAYLTEAIKSILCQAEQVPQGAFEIIISDNVSTDNTAVIVEQIMVTSKSTIRYYKNDQNVGFDGNCLLAVERAAGEYVWLFGDDDLFAEGALKNICGELMRSQEIDVFLGEKEDFFLTPKQAMRRRRVMNYKETRVFDFRQTDQIDEYFRQNKKLIAYLNFISIIIFKRSSWLAVNRKEDFVGSGYIHVYVLHSLLWSGKRGQLKYLPFAFARRRWGSDPNYDIEVKLKMDFQIFRRIAAVVFAEQKYRWLIDDLVIRNDGFSWAVRVKIAHPFRFLMVHLPFLFWRYWDHPLFWLKIFPLIFTPNFILKLLRGGYRSLVKGEPLKMSEMLGIEP